MRLFDRASVAVGAEYTRNLSYEDEAEFLSKYAVQGNAGKIIDTKELKAEYEAKVGHTIGGSQIYRVLSRHSWRKVMPRSKHPKKASDEVIETSKKLKQK